MGEVILFPDIEALLVSAVAADLGVPVSTRIPDERPDTFIRLVRVGGTRRGLVTDAAMVVFECWAPTGLAASTLARNARAFVHSLDGEMVNGEWIRRVVDITGPQFYPDPESGASRYQFTIQIDTRGTAA